MERHDMAALLMIHHAWGASENRVSSMQQKFDWLRRFCDRHEPRIEHLATFWTVRGPSNRDLTCSAYRIQTGLELRVEYSPEDVVASRLFRGRDADERLAENADAGRLTLIASGFREIAK
jgi:hypothetical protein